MHCSNWQKGCCLVNAHCNVKEDDEGQKEHFQSTWLDLVMETRPADKATVFEKDISRKESYTQAQVTHFLVRRSPNQRIELGRQGEQMYHLPYQNALPLPIFVPRKVQPAKDSIRMPTPAELRGIIEFEKALSSGVCAEKTSVSHITRDMPKVVQPVCLNFTPFSLVSPPGDSSPNQQRRL